jgi:YidC/Oxa1 family membrane protein insertase
MEDKRTALAVLLCMFVLMFWMEIVMAPYKKVTPPQPSQNPQTTTATNLPQNQTQQFPPANTVAAVPAVKNPNAAEIKDAGYVNVEGPLYKLQISKLGGRLAGFQLKNYKAFRGSDNLLDLVLVNEGPLPLGILTGELNDAFVKYNLDKTDGIAANSDNGYVLTKSDNFTLHFSGKLNDQITITKILTFQPSTYLAKVNVELSAPSPGGSPIWIEWPRFNAHPETGRVNHEYFAVLGADNKVKQIELPTVMQPLVEAGPAQWISYGDRYFMATLISQQPNSFARVGKVDSLFYSRISGPSQKAEFNLYMGPKSHEILKASGFQLERSVDLGMFAFIAHPLLACLNFFYTLLGNYGLAIILLTLLIKFLFLPLTKTSFKSMNAMQKLQPEIKALRERIQDPTQLNQEMMALYKKHGVNPMGGCLPMLIQLPVFLGLYNALNNSIQLRHAPFALWITDLSSVERLDVFGVGIPVMVLLMGLSMFIQQWTTPSSADPQQKKIMMMMPVIFTVSFVIFPFPSGLVLYWLINNLISIIQQVYLRSEKHSSVFQGTALASILIFFAGYVLTLI